jgi:hypothetical protein
MIGSLASTAQAANADEISAGQRASRAAAITGDLLLVRPTRAMGSLFGAVLFIPTAILSAPTGWDNVMDAYELLIREPFHATFQRPLGRP